MEELCVTKLRSMIGWDGISKDKIGHNRIR